MDKNLKQIISGKLSEHRRRNGLSQEKLAEMIGISQSFYTKLENGQRLPSLKVLFALAQALNVRIGELLEDKNQLSESHKDIQKSIMFMLQNKSVSDLKSVERMIDMLLEELSIARQNCPTDTSNE